MLCELVVFDAGLGWAVRVQVAEKKREEIGVELYAVQQQLAKLQMNLEKTHDGFNKVQRIRQQVRVACVRSFHGKISAKVVRV